MSRLIAVALMVTAFSCQAPEPSLCGDGEELHASGTTACLYNQQAALIEEGFQCPPEVSVRTDLNDGAVLCSEEANLPPAIEEQLEAQGYERPTQGSSWSFDDADPGLNNTPTDTEQWVLGTLIDLDVDDPFVVDEPLEKARICVMDAEPENCTMTDANGQFALPMATETEFALTAELDGYYSTILPVVPISETAPAGTPNVRLMDWGMTSVDREMGLLTGVGVAQDPTLGLLSVAISGHGVIATVEPGDDEGWYPDGSTLVRSATGTTSEYGEVRFPNLAAGDYTVSATSDILDCFASGWPGTAENTIRIPIRAGFMTSPLTIRCR